MKKLFLSMLIVLGAMVSTQAQTFDFSCFVLNSATAPEFTAPQMTSLMEAQYAENEAFQGGTELQRFVTIHRHGLRSDGTPGPLFDPNGNPVTFQREISITHYVPAKERFEDGVLVEYIHYGIDDPSFTRNHYYTNVEDALAAALELSLSYGIVDPNADSGNGFTNAEVLLLGVPVDNTGAIFNQFSVGEYNIPTIDGLTNINISKNTNGSFFVWDDNDEIVFESSYATLELAIAAAVAAR